MFIRRDTRGERGAATVEMAISMLIIVPVILYALFLDDLLRFRLDAQEAAVSSVWDFTNRSYQQRPKSSNGKDAPTVQHIDRLIFCDHSSAFDSFNWSQDCQDPRHHQAVAGHQCWLLPGAEQITCTLKDPMLGAQWPGGAAMLPANKFRDTYNQGGLFTCEAQESVMNYLLPKHFLQRFSSVDITDKKKFKGNVHTAAKSASYGDVYHLAKEQLGLVADTWAMNDIPNTDPWDKGGSGAKGQMYDRVKTIYTHNAGYYLFILAGEDFYLKAVESGLLAPWYVQTPMGGGLGDNPFIPHISLRKETSASGVKQPIEQRSGTVNYFDTPWDSKTGDPRYQKTYQQRGQYYLGHKKAESNK